MRRVIGMNIHRAFAEVVFWEDGRLRHQGRIDMTRSGLSRNPTHLGPGDLNWLTITPRRRFNSPATHN